MYNADRKNRFIAESGISSKTGWAESVFNNTAIVESKLDKDIAEMTADEVGMAIISNDVMSATTTTNRIPLIVRYKKWCADQGFKSVLIQSGDVQVDVSDGIRSTMVYSPSRLLEILEQAFPDDGRKNTPRCVYRSYMWFAFSGLRPVEAVDVRIRDVDLRRRLVSYNHRWYRIFEQSIPDIRTACELTVFEKPTPKGNKIMVRPREDSDRVLRGWSHSSGQRSPEHYVRHTLRTTIQSAFDEAGLKGVSAQKVRKSGIFYDMLGREMKGLDVKVAFYTLASDDFELDHRGVEVGLRQKHKAVHRVQLMYEKDFQWWKRAFREELMKEFNTDSIPGLGD